VPTRRANPPLNTRQILVLAMALTTLMGALAPSRLPHAGTGYLTISPVFKFRTSNAAGDIQFTKQFTTTGWYWSGGLIHFQQPYLGAGYVWSNVGFDCSANATMTITSLEKHHVKYTVAAASGVTSTTKLSFPSNRKVSKVTGATSWTPSGSTVTVTVLHHSPATITVYLTPVSPQFNTIRTMWGSLFMLIVLVALFSGIQDILRGGEGAVFILVLKLAGATALIFIMLQVVEGLW